MLRKEFYFLENFFGIDPELSWIIIHWLWILAEPETAVPVRKLGNCENSMTYCEAMSMYCDNPEYRGVRMYCRQTCNSCDEDFSAYEDPAALAGDEDGRNF